MEFRENRDIAQELGKEKYRENVELLNKAKDRFVEMGIFEKDFINGLNFVFIDNVGQEGEEFRNYQLAPDGKIVPLDLDEEKITGVKDVFLFTKDFSEKFLENFDNLFRERDEKHQSSIIWLKGVDVGVFYSFDAMAAHESAHTKSYAAIAENGSLLFDKEKFSSMIREVLEGSGYSRKFKSIDFSKFDLSVFDWSELYALLHHREFLRKENGGNIAMIGKWDDHIADMAGDLQGSVEKFNKEKGVDIDPEVIYEDCHAFSFLLARLFEEKYEDFDERIKALETCKK